MLFSQGFKLDSKFLGVYTGDQKGYTLKDKFGDDRIVMGQKIIIPNVNHKFLLEKNNIASLKQTALDDSGIFYYDGTYKVKNDGDLIIIESSLTAENAKLDFKIIIDKSKMTAEAFAYPWDSEAGRFIIDSDFLRNERKIIKIAGDKIKIDNYRKLSINLSATEKLIEIDKLIYSLNNNNPKLNQEKEQLLNEIENDKIESYRKLSINLSATEKLIEIDKLIYSLNNNNPKLNQEKEQLLNEIENDKIESYRKLSLNLSNFEKSEELKKLISSLNGNYPGLSQELRVLNIEIQKDKIDSFIKRNDFKSAREFVKKMDENDITEEVLEKTYPNYKILKKVYNDIYKAEGIENFGNDANVYILLYLLNLSTIEFKNAKWYKGAFGTSRLVLMGFDNKLYGGLGWRQAKGLQFKLEKISSSSLPKIKNNLISRVPLYKEKKSDMQTQSYVDKDDLTDVEYIFGRRISDQISPNEFYKYLKRKSKNNKGYPSGDVFEIRYDYNLRVK